MFPFVAMPIIFFLSGFGEMFGDFNIMLKIFVLISIASFAQNHLGKGPLTIFLILFVAFFVFFAEGLWPFFGGVFVFYLLLMFGVSSMMIDYIFVAVFPLGAQQQQRGGDNPFESRIGSGKDLAERGQQMQRAQQMLSHKPGMRPPPMAG